MQSAWNDSSSLGEVTKCLPIHGALALRSLGFRVSWPLWGRKYPNILFSISVDAKFLKEVLGT